LNDEGGGPFEGKKRKKKLINVRRKKLLLSEQNLAKV